MLKDIIGIKIDNRIVYNEGSKNVGLEKAYDIYELDSSSNYSYVSLFYLTGKFFDNDGRFSFINYYDNKLYIPKNVFSPSKVYIRHEIVDENGNVISVTGNDSEILNSNGKESKLSNSKFAANNTHSSDYPEYYEISSGETLKASRLLTLIESGNYYELEQVKKVTKGTYDEAIKNIKNAQPITENDKKTPSNIVEVTASDETKVTVITFRYKKVGGPNDGEPKGGVETLESNNELENCQMSYTPTNVDIKPYLEANKFKLKDLKYSYKENGNSIEYSISTFNIYKLISGSIANNSDEGKTGEIFGGDNDRWTLLSGSSPQEFPVNYGDISVINNYMDGYSHKLPNKQELNKTLFKKGDTTNKDNFSKTFYVPTNRYNGLRIPKLIANYKEYDVINNNYIGNVKSDDTSNTAKVLVYNPIKVKPPTIKSEGVVDHSPDGEGSSVIQKNANFELSLELVNDEYYTGHPYSEYLERYYLIFDIDIVITDNTKYTQLYEKDNLTKITKKLGDFIEAGTLIELSKDAKTFNAKASSNINTGDKVSQNKSRITLIGVSNNMPGDVLLKEVLKSESDNTLTRVDINKYISTNNNEFYEINGEKVSVKKDYCDGSVKYTDYKVHGSEYYGENDMYGDAYYFAKAVKEITNIGRIYDFKVTDCSDIDYKEVFRETKANGVNNLKGIVYFSGIKELKIYSNDVNTLEDRTDISISNSASKRILPLGPYKNTDTSYVSAPKMGYRISFDLKTSGYYDYTDEASNSTREIHITPSYYYISKDGKTFNNNINLYYKNSSGKYVKFDGSDYTIYFKPKDGYRSIYNSEIADIDDDSIMSEQLEPLTIGSSDGFTLNYKMMSTSGNNFLQAWYGEFKLPNSTIAVEGNNVSKPLTDGYIGVIFDIQCIDNKGTLNEKKLSYNKNNNNANPNINTTQWDYEGFLGFSNPGSKSGDISIQLEKGTWTVNDDNSSPKAKYTDIKGTVVLFDIDNRAANDFD